MGVYGGRASAREHVKFVDDWPVDSPAVNCLSLDELGGLGFEELEDIETITCSACQAVVPRKRGTHAQGMCRSCFNRKTAD